MNVTVQGADGPVARATRAELIARGHVVTDRDPSCAMYFPGSLAGLQHLVDRGVPRLVLRSRAFVVGANPKNPGFISEERASLLPPNSEAQHWLKAEAILLSHPNWAALRLTNVLAGEEGDVVVRQLASRVAFPPAGRDPNLQFISVRDAARALADAVESPSTGVFNIAADGVIPLKRALRAAHTLRIPVPETLLRLRGNRDETDQLTHNWTVSSERATRELGFEAQSTAVEALRDFLAAKPSTAPAILDSGHDDWGLDESYILALGWWFNFLQKVYWRIDHEGFENIPEVGRAMFVASHRGFMPLDAVMYAWLAFKLRRRVPRFLIISSLLRMPFLSNFLTKFGGVVASQENAARLFEGEHLVGLFPEGIRGAFTPYRTAYKLRDFAKSEFARIALRNRAPIVPVAVIGHAEIFPIIGRIDSAWVTRTLGWPYFPIAPMFPLAPIPLPSKWHIRVLPMVPLQGLGPADADNDRLVRDFSRYIQSIVQRNVDDMLPHRKSIFYGRVLNGTAPATAPFQQGLAADNDSKTTSEGDDYGR